MSERDRLGSDRFAFGRNWTRFLAIVDTVHIGEAERSLKRLLAADTLQGRRFLDVGCGSGLFSLAARRLGATVHSFDYDPECVRCAQQLRSRFSPDDEGWTIGPGSALDPTYLATLGQFDIVYSWGVLHHTGAMWDALDRVLTPLDGNGTLCIAIYNDQGWQSTCWWQIKKLYNALPDALKGPYAAIMSAPIVVGSLLRAVLTGRSIRTWLNYSTNRGMSRWHDLIDWVGGFPFEVAAPEQIINFYGQRGLALVRQTTVGRKLGCNEFVFRRG